MQQSATVRNSFQQDLRLFGVVENKVVEGDWQLVQKCRSFSEALMLSIRYSRVHYDNGTLADMLEMDRSCFQCMLNPKKRPRQFPPDKISDFQQITGNRIPSQYLELKEKGMLLCQQEESI